LNKKAVVKLPFLILAKARTDEEVNQEEFL
jgi:hypothetical protein